MRFRLLFFFRQNFGSKTVYFRIQGRLPGPCFKNRNENQLYTVMCLDERQIYAFQEQLFFSHSLCLFSNPEIYPQILLNQHIKNPILKFALKRWEYEVFGNLKRKE